MRTVENMRTSGALVVGSLEVEPDAYRATLGGRTLALSPSQVAVLRVLVANRDRVVSRSELAKAAGLEQAGSVDVVLSALRRLLGEAFVRNVRNRGWIVEPSALER
jgi:DNA-binding response OmpR family regulator